MNKPWFCSCVATKRAIAIFCTIGFFALLLSSSLAPASAATTTYYLDITLGGGDTVNGSFGFDPTSGGPVSDDLLLAFAPPSTATLSFSGSNPMVATYPSYPTADDTTFRMFTNIVDGYNLEVQTEYANSTATLTLDGVILCGPGTTNVEDCAVADVGDTGYLSTTPQVSSTPLPSSIFLFIPGLLVTWWATKKAAGARIDQCACASVTS